MSSSTIKGRRPGNRRGRQKKRSSDPRTCAEEGCHTKLSSYNLAKRCFNHRPRRFPRVIGRRKRKK